MTQDVSLPQPSVSTLPQRARISNIITALNTFFDTASSGIKTSLGNITESPTSYRLRRQFKKNKFFFIPLAIIAVLLIGGLVMLFRGGTSVPQKIAGVTDDRVELQKPIATTLVSSE